MDYIQKGIDEGAKLLFGGVSSGDQKGFFAKPTLFDDLKENMTIAQEEIFGPVLGVLTINSDEEALKIASNSKYGLHASVLLKILIELFIWLKAFLVELFQLILFLKVILKHLLVDTDSLVH